MALVTVMLAPCSPAEAQRSSTDPVIEVDVDDPPDTRHRFTEALTFGVELKLTFEFKKDLDLDTGADDALATAEPQFTTALSFDPSERLRAFLELELSREFSLDSPAGSERKSTELNVEQAYVTFREITDGLSLQIGRQKFKDGREWLYDEELDAVRLHFHRSRAAVELSASRGGLVGKDLLNLDRAPRINNYFLVGRYAVTEDAEAGAYLLVRDDRNEPPEDLIFAGLRSYGDWGSNASYWLEAAFVGGEDRPKNIRAYGFDIGGSYQLASRFKPTMTLGLAFGSGDSNSKDGVDRNFRQTDLQDNNGKFNGVTSFKYYGEVFDPELSNMAIVTAGLGVRPTKRSSIDLVYHYYRQHRTSKKLRNVGIDLAPEGTDRALGHEIDAILGYREVKDLKLELVLGVFFPGRAFPRAADNAFFGALEIKYDF